MKENLRTILRCTGLAAVVIAVLVLVPTAAEAQCNPAIHGATIFKQCVSPKNACTSDLDCSDGLFCNGVEQCATEEAPGSNLVDCTIILENPLSHCDDINVVEAADAILGGTGIPSSSTDILVVSSSGGEGPGCDAGSNLGGAEICTLSPGDSITFQANYYAIQPADPNPLSDQATVTVIDTCNAGISGCSTTPNTVQFTAATDTVTGCSPGTPVDCPDDGNACNGPEACDETLDACASGPPIICEQDGDLCTAPTVCDPATGQCVPDGADVTCPDDGDLCTAPEVCDPKTGLCVPDGADVVCTDPVCEICDPTTGLCVDRDPLPAECVPSDEICRTPGFFGTHAGTEKANSTNITGAILALFNADNDPDLQICGETISDVDTVLEAICVSPKGDQQLQLIRQLTAAALNCILSSATGTDAESCEASLLGPVCEGVSIGEFFDACNAACAAGDVTIDHDTDPATEEVSCIGLIDCFNNGGIITFDEATGEFICEEAEEGVETCHDRDLVTECFNFPQPGPAGSPRACNEARKNLVEITD